MYRGGTRAAIVGMAKTIRNIFTAEGQKFARQANVARNQAVDDYIEAVTGVVQGRKEVGQRLGGMVLKATGFKMTETANRLVAANIGREDLTGDLVKRLLKNPRNEKVLQEFKSFRIDPE